MACVSVEFSGQGFDKIIVINGYGAAQTAVLYDLAEKTGRAHHVRAKW